MSIKKGITTVSRVFQTIEEAGLEIRRDLKKGTAVTSSRVQQHVGQVLPGREKMGYEYVIMDEGIPRSASDLVQVGRKLELRPYLDHPNEMLEWLYLELQSRLYPLSYITSPPTEMMNPLLKNTIEGNYPSYTYRERLAGALPAITYILECSPDSRRAYWPIFLPQDSLRASQPTRVPCSLGYELMIRSVNGEPRVQVFYISRSCDFDRFWLSDIWFAYQFGLNVATSLGYRMGAVYHYVISFHSFDAEMKEIY